MPVSVRDPDGRLKPNLQIIFRALVALEPLVSLRSRFGGYSARVSGDRHTHT